MKNNERSLYGLLITIVIFVSAVSMGYSMDVLLSSIANRLATFVASVLLTCWAIYIFKKNLNFTIALPQVKPLFRAIGFTILISIGVNIVLTILTLILGGEREAHPIMNELTPLQVILFGVICGPISEELLFRGFLLNYLKPMFTGGFYINKRRISTPILISAIAFSLAHLVLIYSGVGLSFILGTLIFTFVLGLIAGYYQEKHQNTAYAILVHMSANLLGALSLLSKLH